MMILKDIDWQQGIVGKESAKIGQGKAFKAGWIKKDKDTLRANVTSMLTIIFHEVLNLVR